MRGKAKEQAEIDGEKEIIEISTVQAMSKNKYGNVTKNELEEKLNSNLGEGKTEVIDSGDTLVVKFIESNRYYEVDDNGNVKNIEVKVDKNPGNIKIVINGEELKGTEESPFEIWCIEDLIEMSQNYTDYQNAYIKLGRTLDFKLELSYADSKSKTYEDINDNDKIETLIEEMQNGIGFTPIYSFSGTFDGNNCYIKNIFQKGNNGGVFSTLSNGTIENLNITGNMEITGNAGGIAAIISNSNIINCNNFANIIASQSSGGITGWGKNSTIINCSNSGNLINNEVYGYGIGGIVGSGVFTTVINCYTTFDTLIESENAYVGGIIGYVDTSTSKCTIYNCYNLSEINGKTVGGIVGYIYSGYIDCINCYTTGNLSGTSVGGIIGGYLWFNGDNPIINCYYEKNDIVKQGCSKKIMATGINILTNDELNNMNLYIDNNQSNTSNWKKWSLNNQGHPSLN